MLRTIGLMLRSAVLESFYHYGAATDLFDNDGETPTYKVASVRRAHRDRPGDVDSSQTFRSCVKNIGRTVCIVCNAPFR